MEREFLIRWNNRRPLDREYRKKHNIAFNSPEHRAINQIDIFLEFYEETLYKEFLERAQDELKMEEEYRKDNWLKEQAITDDEADDIWSKMDMSAFNEPNSQIKLDE